MTDESLNAEDPGTQSPSTEGGSFNAEDNETNIEFEVNGRKYNVASASKKLQHQDQHIKTLEEEREAERRELAELKEALRKAENTAEILARKQETNSDTHDRVDPDEVARKAASHVRATLDEENRIKQQKENLSNVKDSLTKKYGKSVDDIVAKVIAPLGMTKAEAMEFAKSKPQAFLAFFDKVAPPPPTATTGTVNTAGLKGEDKPTPKKSIFTANTDKERTQIYLDRLSEATKRASAGG